MENKAKRLPRFRRSAEEVRIMKLTSRDKEVIRQVARFHFLRSTQICQLVDGSPIQVLRRLQMLFHHGYLDRPRCQIDFFHQGGSRPMVYGLGSRGAAFMRRQFDVPFHRMVWARSEKSIGRVFLEHTLMVAEIVIAVSSTCRASSGTMRFISGEELQEPRNNHTTFKWSATIQGKRQGLIPDAVFALDLTDEISQQQRIICFLEADRGTMPVARRSPYASSIAHKLALYSHLWKSGAFEKTFRTKRMAVHTVTSSATRAENIRQAVKSLTSGRGLFATHVLEEITSTPDRFIHHSAQGQGV